MKTPVHVELWYDDNWHDITDEDRVYTRDPITILRGRQGELSRVSPSKMDLSIKNNDGKYSIRNPMSELWGKLKRNQPIRCWCRLFRDDFTRTETNQWGFAPDGQPWQTFSLGGTAADFDVNGSAATHLVDGPSEYRASILGSPSLPYRDCEIRTQWTLSMSDVTGGAVEPANLFLRSQATNTYYFLRLSISTSEVVTVQIRKVISGSETTLTSAITVAGLTFAGQALMAAFMVEGPILAAKAWDPAVGEPHGWQAIAVDHDLPDAGHVGIRTGVSGGNTNIPVTASYDFFEVRNYRTHTEVESWPQRWTVDADENGTRGDVWAPITCNGIMFRLGGAGSQASEHSAIYRFVTANSPRVYWPLDDGANSIEGRPAVDGTGPMVVDYSSGEAAVRWASGELAPWLSRTLAIEGTFVATGAIPDPLTTTYSLEVAIRSQRPSGNLASVRIGFNDAANASGANIKYYAIASWNSGSPTLDLYAEDDALSATLLDSASSEDALRFWDDQLHTWDVTLIQVGADVQVSVVRDTGVSVMNGTHSSATLKTGSKVRLSTLQARAIFGHTVVWQHPPVSAGLYYDAVAGHPGEQAHERIARLCEEEGIAFVTIGDASAAVGPQRHGPVLESLFESADADGGILYEPRGFFGLVYVTHTALYNQLATVTVDYVAGGEVAPPLEPSEDTDHVKNDVTVTRIDGGPSARAVQETGPLNIQEPKDDPQGVGRYPVNVALNLETDSQTLQQAAWIKHLGTWDEPRYEAVNLDLGAMDADGKIELLHQAASLDISNRLVITNPPVWQGPDDVNQQTQGYNETLGSHTWIIETNTTPDGPWQVGVLDTDRLYGSTTISEDLTTTETTITVPSGVFSTTNEPYDVIVGGEVMTVTSATSTVLTVTRSVNGVVKTHTTGDTIEIYQPLRLARGA